MDNDKKNRAYIYTYEFKFLNKDKYVLSTQKFKSCCSYLWDVPIANISKETFIKSLQEELFIPFKETPDLQNIVHCLYQGKKWKDKNEIKGVTYK